MNARDVQGMVEDYEAADRREPYEDGPEALLRLYEAALDAIADGRAEPDGRTIARSVTRRLKRYWEAE